MNKPAYADDWAVKLANRCLLVHQGVCRFDDRLGPVPAGTAMTLDALKKAGVPVLAYGQFITVALNFLILAFIIFLMVRQINRLRRKHAAEVVAPAEDVVLLREIRDSLRRP